MLSEETRNIDIERKQPCRRKIQGIVSRQSHEYLSSIGHDEYFITKLDYGLAISNSASASVSATYYLIRLTKCSTTGNDVDNIDNSPSVMTCHLGIINKSLDISYAAAFSVLAFQFDDT